MNISIHIVNQNTAKSLKRMAKVKGKSRNSLINEALNQYVENQAHAKWPEEAKQLAGAWKGMRFEDYRKELLPPKDDPFE